VIFVGLAAVAAVIWLGILLVPWLPWSTRERLDATAQSSSDLEDLSTVTVLIPARDEAAVLPRTIDALRGQGEGLRIVIVDDQSTDGTAEAARKAGGPTCEVVTGAPIPDGWVGKLWALEQGRHYVRTPLTLLIDADIEIRPGLVPALLARRRTDEVQLVSLMAVLAMGTLWEKLLVPAFVYFFKLLYPFRLSNSPTRLVAAAAGGCILVETAMLERIGGFGSLRHALIDDCTLARRVKEAGGRTWIGLTHSAVSLRPMGSLGAIWRMVARSAFAQLNYSLLLLLACVTLLAVAFWVPIAGLFITQPQVRWLSAIALGAMVATYVPTLLFYGRSPLWALALPITGTLYLLMTVSSAVREWRGLGASWKGRAYGARAARIA
jgi:hopene-associated glycosyltransferase HpnB